MADAGLNRLHLYSNSVEYFLKSSRCIDYDNLRFYPNDIINNRDNHFAVAYGVTLSLIGYPNSTGLGRNHVEYIALFRILKLVIKLENEYPLIAVAMSNVANWA